MSQAPQPTKIEVVESTEVIITWDDGSVSSLTATKLRAVCPCAGCREQEGRRQTDLVVGGPVPVTISSAALVGGYAVNFVFGPDGHGTGIFPFGALHEVGESGSSS